MSQEYRDYISEKNVNDGTLSQQLPISSIKENNQNN